MVHAVKERCGMVRESERMLEEDLAGLVGAVKEGQPGAKHSDLEFARET